MSRPAIAPEERFERYIEPEPMSGCWLWVGTVTRNGYALFYSGVRYVYVHRWAYEHFVGPIPRGLQIDHKCRTRCCVNPKHLEPVTAKENSRRSPLKNLSHCRHGHSFDEGNTIIERRRVQPSRRRCWIIRRCRVCVYRAMRRQAEKKKLEYWAERVLMGAVIARLLVFRALNWQLEEA